MVPIFHHFIVPLFQMWVKQTGRGLQDALIPQTYNIFCYGLLNFLCLKNTIYGIKNLTFTNMWWYILAIS